MSAQHDDILITGRAPHPGHSFAHDSQTEEEHPTVTVAWGDLYALAKRWSRITLSLSRQMMRAPLAARAFQGIGQGFLALSHLESAYAHYYLVGNRLRYPPSVIVEGLEQTLTELHEACTRWVSVRYWLEQLANEVDHGPDLLGSMRTGVHLACEQQQHLQALIAHVQQDQAQAQQRAARWQQQTAASTRIIRQAIDLDQQRTTYWHSGQEGHP